VTVYPPTGEERLASRVAECALNVAVDYLRPAGDGIHKIAPRQAWQLAPVLIGAARDHDVPLAYLMGAVAQESRFDPAATNFNHTDGMDYTKCYWGIAQFSGANLSLLEWKLAMDPEWALQRMASVYRMLLDWSKVKFAGSDPLYVATMAYNQGRTGAALIVERKPHPTKGWVWTVQHTLLGHKHAKAVMKFRARFDAMLAASTSDAEEV